jgi:hypothetical protein
MPKMIYVTRLFTQVIFWTMAIGAYGQTANVPFASPVLTFLGANGQPLANGTVTTFSAGTTTPLSTFPSANTLTPNPNPTVLSAGGQAQIWLGSTACYKFVVKNSAGVLQWSADNVCANNLSSISKIVSNNCTSPGPSTSGFIQMCNGDLINWRNISNTANIGLAQAGIAATATGNTADILWYGSNSTGGIQAQKFLDFSTAPAQTGVFACGNNVACVTQRNAAGNADITAVQVNGSNITALGGSAGTLFAGPWQVPNTQNITNAADSPLALNIQAGVTADQNESINFIGHAGGALGGISENATFGNMFIGPKIGQTIFFGSQALTSITDAGRLTVGTGVSSGTGIQLAAGTSCSTAASANAACSTTVTWTNAFADTNYIVFCQSLSSVSGGLVIPTFAANTSTTTSVIAFQNIGANAAASSANYGCLAIHL